MPRPRKGDQCARERWRVDVLRAKNLPASTRMFLVSVLAPHMRTDGFVSTPRADLADEMDVDERTVTRYFARAKEAGWLTSMRTGHKGLTAEYMASWPTSQSGTAVVPLSRPRFDAQRGTETGTQRRDKNVPLTGQTKTPKRDTWCPAKVSTFGTTRGRLSHNTRTCTCEPCTEWRFVMHGRVRAEGVGPRGFLELESLKSKSKKTAPLHDARASA